MKIPAQDLWGWTSPKDFPQGLPWCRCTSVAGYYICRRGHVGGDGCNEELPVLMALTFGTVASCSWGPITCGCCKRLPLKVGNAVEISTGGLCTCLRHDTAHHVQPCAVGVEILWLPVRTCQPLSKAVFQLRAAK